MTIQVIPHQIHGYDTSGTLLFSLTETDLNVCRIEVKADHHTLESWCEFSIAVRKAFAMFADDDAAAIGAHKEGD